MRNPAILLICSALLFGMQPSTKPHLPLYGPVFTVTNSTGCQFDIQAEGHNGNCTPDGNYGTAYACTAHGTCDLTFVTGCLTCETLRFRIKETGQLNWSNWAGNPGCSQPNPTTYNSPSCGTVTLEWTSATTGVIY